MSLRDTAKIKMLQVETAAAQMDGLADYAEANIGGFAIKAMGAGGKTYEFKIVRGDPAFDALLNGFTKLVTKHQTDAKATLAAVGIQA